MAGPTGRATAFGAGPRSPRCGLHHTLGAAFGAAQALAGVAQLRAGHAAAGEGWAQVAVGGCFIALYGLLWFAQRRPEVFLRRLPPPGPARLAKLDGRLVRREVIEGYLQRGERIQAIRVYREDTGADLAEAKGAVEVLAARQPDGTAGR